jgi:hypothetical protein
VGWDSLLAIYQEALDIEAEERSRPPEDCPHCATTLTSGPDGGLYCPFTDHFFWPEDS